MTSLSKRIAAVFAAIFLPMMLAACGINDIPTREEAAKARWGDVEANYQRRANLIPNLVETVKGYAAQERTVLNEVVNARARATAINITGTPTPHIDAVYALASLLAETLQASKGRLRVENG